eukprot:scaffold9405_cov111-Cylindrotheca_fusiformis.AAC.5
MATYQSAYPALLPLASGAHDFPAPAIDAGAPLNDGDMDAATRQVKSRRYLREIDSNQATISEVQDAVKRELCVHVENAAGAVDAVAMPPWALNLQNRLTDTMQANQDQTQANQDQTNRTLQTIQNTLTTMQNQMNTMQNGIDDNRNMVLNASSIFPEDTVRPVRNDNGILPSDAPRDAQGRPFFFPNTRWAVDDLTELRLSSLMRFYGLEREPAESRGNQLQRLQLRLGLRLP